MTTLDIFQDVVRILTFQTPLQPARNARPQQAGTIETPSRPQRVSDAPAAAVPARAELSRSVAIGARKRHLREGQVLGTGALSLEHPHRHATRPASQGRNWPGPWRKTPGRVFGTSFVRLYQLTLSGFVGNSCRHLPTCSEYAYEAIARHGLWTGGWMGLFRVMRCGPWGTHGIDRVPETLESRYRWYTPWRCWHIGKHSGPRH